MIDILFILKKNETYGFKTTTRRSSGLWNSTRFIVEGLFNKGIKAHIVEVIDNNCIDRHVRHLKPKLVIIEALWVVPEKFAILRRLHPRVQWFIHMHSGMSFLAQEGIATEWLRAYPNYEVSVIANSHDTYESFKEIIPGHQLYLLPNVYIPNRLAKPKRWNRFPGVINVGCFGAVRPLKNQLVQAFAALRYAREHDKFLVFHINGTRQEVGGMPVIKNIRNLFKDNDGAYLEEHPWYEPEDFHRLLIERIDVSMQVSLSETFNVVSADAVTCGVPIVVSNEVRWSSKCSQSDTEDIDDIAEKMERALVHPIITKLNQRNLMRNSREAQRLWLKFVQEETHG